MFRVPQRITTAVSRIYHSARASFTFAILGGLILITAGCPTDSPPFDPEQPAVAETTVELGASIDSQIRSQIVGFRGLAGSLSGSGGGKLSVPDSAHSAVLAVNSAGQPVLGAMVTPGGSRTVDVRASALFLVRLMAPGAAIEPGQAQQLEARIANLPGFGALVDSLDSRARRGMPVTASASAGQAAAVARGLLPSASAAATPVRLASAPVFSIAAFEKHDYVEVNASFPPSTNPVGGQVTFTNPRHAPLTLKVPGGTLRLAKRQVCAACWYTGMDVPSSAGFLLSRDGPFQVTVELDMSAMVVQSVLDASGLIFGKLFDKYIPPAAKTRAIERVEKGLDHALKQLEISLKGKDAAEFQAGIARFHKEHQAEFADIYAQLVPGTETAYWIDALEGVWSAILRVDSAIAPFLMVASYLDAFKTWRFEPETVTWCIEEAGLYGGCSERVVIAPSSVQMQRGTSMPLTAMVYDAQDRILGGRKVRWKVNDASIVSLDVEPDQPAQAASVTALKDEGTATVTATSSGKTGLSRVKLEPYDSTAIYEAAVLGTWTVGLVESSSSGPYRWEVSIEPASSPGWRRGTYIVPHVPVGNGNFYCPNGPAPVDGWCHYGSSWRITRSNGRYYLMDAGFWHPGFNGQPRDPLSIPVTGFTTYHQGAPSRRFIKN